VRLTIALEHCCYSSVPPSGSSSAPYPSSPLLFLPTSLSTLLFAPYSGQFFSSLLAVVGRQYLLYGLLFLPAELLLEQEAATCQSMLEAWRDADGAPLRSGVCSAWCWDEVTDEISCAEVTG